MLSSSIFELALSGGVAAAAPDTKSVLEVVAIAEVDFGGILGTRAGAVAVGMTSDCKVLFTAQDALQFASGGASDGRARQKLAAMIQTDGVPEGFHRGRWKPVNGPREGGGLMRSSLRPRVMCGIRDSSHKHAHTIHTHTHTHTHSRTHTYTQIHTHTHTHTRGQILCALSLEISLSLLASLSLWVCRRVSQGAVMPCSQAQTKTRGNPDRGTRVPAVHSTHPAAACMLPVRFNSKPQSWCCWTRAQ